MSASVKFNVPVGTGLVVSGVAEPVVSASSDKVADSAPLVITTGWLVRRMVTVTFWAAVAPEGSVTTTW